MQKRRQLERQRREEVEGIAKMIGKIWMRSKIWKMTVTTTTIETASLHWFLLRNCRNKPNTLTPLWERGSRIEEEKEELICI
jgi:hypothetical protein